MTHDAPENAPASGAEVRLPPSAPSSAEMLDDERLLGLLLRPVPGDSDRLAERLMVRFGSLGGVVSADASELRRALPRKPDGLHLIELARELAVRLARESARRRQDITSWTELRTYVRTMMAHRPREQFGLYVVDRLFDRAELRLGGRRPQVVRILRLPEGRS